MEIYLLEYFEEIEYGEFIKEKYNLIGIFYLEQDAQKVRERIIAEKKIEEKFLFISATEVGKLQWRGGFSSV